jgi:hypothetical protein
MKTVPRSIAFRNFFGRRTEGRLCLAEGCVGRTLLSAALDYVVFVFTPNVVEFPNVVELWSVTIYAGSHTKSRATSKPGGQ